MLRKEVKQGWSGIQLVCGIRVVIKVTRQREIKDSLSLKKVIYTAGRGPLMLCTFIWSFLYPLRV